MRYEFEKNFAFQQSQSSFNWGKFLTFRKQSMLSINKISRDSRTFPWSLCVSYFSFSTSFFFIRHNEIKWIRSKSRSATCSYLQSSSFIHISSFLRTRCSLFISFNLATVFCATCFPCHDDDETSSRFVSASSSSSFRCTTVIKAKWKMKWSQKRQGGFENEPYVELNLKEKRNTVSINLPQRIKVKRLE